ncbi:MAG: hypothetical protein EBS53_17755 [Bacteroidetes bacterium]|nr:hypothetical protein [Bacteroidota bacterium]
MSANDLPLKNPTLIKPVVTVVPVTDKYWPVEELLPTAPTFTVAENNASWPTNNNIAPAIARIVVFLFFILISPEMAFHGLVS